MQSSLLQEDDTLEKVRCVLEALVLQFMVPDHGYSMFTSRILRADETQRAIIKQLAILFLPLV